MRIRTYKGPRTRNDSASSCRDGERDAGEEGGPRLRWLVVAAGASLALLLVGVIGASAGAEDRDVVHSRPPSTDRAADHLRWSIENSAAIDSGATTAPADCAAEQPDDRYFYLPTFVAPGEHELSCTVEVGRRVLVDLGGILCLPDEVTPEEELVEFCREAYDSDPNLVAAWLDGRELSVPAAAATGPVTVELGEDNLFEQPAGPTAVAVISKYLEIAGLEKGQHVIRTYHRAGPGSSTPFDVTMTFHIEVTAT